MSYIAHRTECGCEQPLLDHLRGTAERASTFAQPFGAANLAYVLGMAHDIGKYSDAFQKRIRGQSLTTDHSTAGAQELNRLCGALPAYCVAGHHAGLPDGGARTDTGDQPTLCGRLKKRPASYGAFSEEVSLSRPSFAQPHLLGQGGFTVSFWVRMLFSCLVDADFLDTEAFMHNGAPPRGLALDTGLLIDKLEHFIAPWWDAETPLNRTRCEILRACLEAGRTQAPGLFTLTVPTGGGKTVASLAFALEHAKAHGKRRILYVIPFTSIIEQTSDKFCEILGAEQVLEHHSNVDFDDNEQEPDKVRKKLAAENWDMPVIVTTAVQFFESLFSNRPSRCRKLHNLADSIIIFDEAQTLPLPYLLPCVRSIAELVVNYGASCVLCTATQPALAPLFAAAAPTLGIREIAPPVDSSVFRRVTFQHLGQLSDSELASQLNGCEQVLCIVGTRKQAQTVFHLLTPEGSFHLSTLMTPDHRRRVLKKIRARLDAGLPCRVVSTSLIEAGVDVDFPTVYRAEAGLDSEVQAAGRCNREGHRPAESSMVYLFAPDSAYTAHLPHSLRRPLEVAREVARRHPEPDSPEAIEQYFTTLYQYSGSALDQNDIVPKLEEGAHTSSYPFRRVAEAFHIIENDTRAVLIPRTDEARALAGQLRGGQYSRNLFRRAGKESVSIFPQHFEALLARGALEVPDETTAILTDLSPYDEQTGLALLSDTGVGIFL